MYNQRQEKSPVRLSVSQAVLVLTWLVLCHSLCLASDEVPLIAESHSISPQRRNPGCVFGQNFFQLEETWHPVLEPLGEMVCVLCTCHAVFVDNKLQLEGNVDCQNMKTACPVVTCPGALTLPGRCCKTCPGDPGTPFMGGEPMVQSQNEAGIPGKPPKVDSKWEHLTDVPPKDEGRGHYTNFLALLVGRSGVTEVRTKAVASARLTLTSNQLTYSLKLSKVQKAVTLWFQEEQGTVLFEKNLRDFKKNHVCGTWEQIPRLYLSYLQQKQLYVVIGTERHPEGEISGRVEPHRALQTESLSAVLSPSKKDGSGGLAMMTFGSDSSLGVILLHMGVADKKKTTRITLSFNKKKKRVKAIDLIVQPQAGEIAELWSKPRKKDLKSLVRGRLEVVISERNKVLMRGQITYRQSCNVMQAILSPATDQDIHGTGGVALFRITPKGKLEYSLKFSAEEEELSTLVVAEANRGRRTKALCTVNLPPTTTNTVSGSCGSVKANTLQKLFQHDLQVTVNSVSQKFTLRGIIKELIFHEYNDKQGVHVLLTGSELHPSVASLMVGHAWVSVSRLCQLVFLLALDDNQLHQQTGWTSYIKDTETGAVKTLSGTSESIATGSVDLSRELLKSLNDGNIEIGIMTEKHRDGEIGAKIEIPNTCSDMLAKGHINVDSPLNEQLFPSRPSDRIVEDSDDRCMVTSILRDNGEIWHTEDSACVTCNCAKGVSNCHHVECPKLACQNPVQLEGECCPQCPDPTSAEDRKCYFDGDKRHHHYGTIFHPYVIPFGYQKCAVCSCSKGDNEVLCVRLPCPDLPCPQEEAIRRHPQDCCMTCPDNYYQGSSENDATDPPPIRSEDIIKTSTACEVQGVIYSNGSEWKPRVGPFGTMPCITCKCLDGTPRCMRETCPELNCDPDDQIQEQYSCCPSCMSDRDSDKRKQHQR